VPDVGAKIRTDRSQTVDRDHEKAAGAPLAACLADTSPQGVEKAGSIERRSVLVAACAFQKVPGFKIARVDEVQHTLGARRPAVCVRPPTAIVTHPYLGIRLVRPERELDAIPDPLWLRGGSARAKDG